MELSGVGSQYGNAMRRYALFSHQIKRQMKSHKHFMNIVETVYILFLLVIVMIKKHLSENVWSLMREQNIIK